MCCYAVGRLTNCNPQEPPQNHAIVCGFRRPAESPHGTPAFPHDKKSFVSHPRLVTTAQRDALAAAGKSRHEASTPRWCHTSEASATPVHVVRRPTHPRAPVADGALPRAGGGAARRRALFTLSGGTVANLADGDQTAVSVTFSGTNSGNIFYGYCLLVPFLAEMKMRVGDEGWVGGGGLCCWGFAVRGGVAIRGGVVFYRGGWWGWGRNVAAACRRHYFSCIRGGLTGLAAAAGAWLPRLRRLGPPLPVRLRRRRRRRRRRPLPLTAATRWRPSRRRRSPSRPTPRPPLTAARTYSGQRRRWRGGVSETR